MEGPSEILGASSSSSEPVASAPMSASNFESSTAMSAACSSDLSLNDMVLKWLNITPVKFTSAKEVKQELMQFWEKFLTTESNSESAPLLGSATGAVAPIHSEQQDPTEVESNSILQKRLRSLVVGQCDSSKYVEIGLIFRKLWTQYPGVVHTHLDKKAVNLIYKFNSWLLSYVKNKRQGLHGIEARNLQQLAIILVISELLLHDSLILIDTSEGYNIQGAFSLFQLIGIVDLPDNDRHELHWLVNCSSHMFIPRMLKILTASTFSMQEKSALYHMLYFTGYSLLYSGLAVQQQHSFNILQLLELVYEYHFRLAEVSYPLVAEIIISKRLSKWLDVSFDLETVDWEVDNAFDSSANAVTMQDLWSSLIRAIETGTYKNVEVACCLAPYYMTYLKTCANCVTKAMKVSKGRTIEELFERVVQIIWQFQSLMNDNNVEYITAQQDEIWKENIVAVCEFNFAQLESLIQQHQLVNDVVNKPSLALHRAGSIGRLRRPRIWTKAKRPNFRKNYLTITKESRRAVKNEEEEEEAIWEQFFIPQKNTHSSSAAPAADCETKKKKKKSAGFIYVANDTMQQHKPEGYHHRFECGFTRFPAARLRNFLTHNLDTRFLLLIPVTDVIEANWKIMDELQRIGIRIPGRIKWFTINGIIRARELLRVIRRACVEFANGRLSYGAGPAQAIQDQMISDFAPDALGINRAQRLPVAPAAVADAPPHAGAAAPPVPAVGPVADDAASISTAQLSSTNATTIRSKGTVASTATAASSQQQSYSPSEQSTARVSISTSSVRTYPDDLPDDSMIHESDEDDDETLTEPSIQFTRHEFSSSDEDSSDFSDSDSDSESDSDDESSSSDSDSSFAAKEKKKKYQNKRKRDASSDSDPDTETSTKNSTERPKKINKK